MARRPFFLNRSKAMLRNMNRGELRDRATIWHYQDGLKRPGGFRDVSRVVDETDVPCRLAPLNLRIPQERALADQFGSDVRWKVIFEAGKVVTHEKYITVTGSTNGVAYRVELEVVGEFVSEHEMLHTVACSSLKEMKDA